MKRVISVLCALLVLTAGAFAQGPQGPRKNDDNGWGGTMNVVFDVGKTAKKTKK